MPVQFTDRILHDERSGLHINKVFGGGKSIAFHISFGIDKFVDYQRDLFEDFFSILVDYLERDDTDFHDFKKRFETDLQDLNTKLAVFAEKIEDVDRFPVKGSVQVFYGSEYLASLIGGVGLMVLRDGKLNFMMSNQEDASAPINLFSELIEGEIKEYDEVINLGVSIDTYIDTSDVATIRDVSEHEQKNFLDGLIDMLRVRVDEKDMGFVSSSIIESSALFSQKKLQKNMSSTVKQVGQLAKHWAPYQGYLVYTAIGLVALTMMWRIIQSFLASNEARFVDDSGGVVVDFSIEDIQKDIAMFKRIDPSSGEKINKYQEIIAQLNLLEQNNRRTNDVTELRKILEAEYYKGFNIVLAHNESFFQEPVYEFTQQEKNTFASPQQIFYKDGLMIGGEQGVLLGAVNNEVRGTLVSASAGMEFSECTVNLLKNGLYCATADGSLYNIGKSGLNPVTNAANQFPTNILQMGTFGSSNLYTLTADPALNNAGTYIVRYTNTLGTQEAFGEGTEYILANQGIATGGDSSGSGATDAKFNSIAIDGTFLSWSPSEKKLYQLRRSDGSANLQSREIPLLGGDTLEGFSANTKVIASPDSRFVYLFDKDNATFTVYRSTPYKTNDANTYTYSLTYFFRIKFALDEQPIIDAFVDEGERSNLYLLTDEGVYSMKLYDYIQSFFEKEAEDS